MLAYLVEVAACNISGHLVVVEDLEAGNLRHNLHEIHASVGYIDMTEFETWKRREDAHNRGKT